MNPYRLISIIPPLIMTLAGIAICIYGFSFLSANSRLETNGIRVKGEVVDINKKAIYRSPFVEFTTESGQKITFLSKLEINQDMFNYEIGQTVDVIYDKSNPNNAEIDAFWERNFGQLFLGIFGIVLILIALLVNRYFSRKARKYAQR